MNTVQTPALPAFPVVTIHLEEGALLADAPGASPVTEPIEDEAVADAVQLNQAGAAAATKVAAELGMDRIQVRIRAHGDEFFMWLDSETGTLHPLEEPEFEKQTQQNPAKTKRAKQVRWIMIGAGVMVLLIVAAVIFRATAGAREPEEPALPGPAQLPAAAPAGWDSYASWAVDASDADPVVVDDDVVYAEGKDIKHAAADNGKPGRSDSVGFTVKAIHRTAGLGDEVISVEGSSSEAAIGRADGTLHELKAPEQSAELDWVSGIPVWSLGTSLWVPDADGKLNKYTVPAESSPATIDRGGVWMVSETDPKAWHITSDSARLPESVAIPTPKNSDGFAGAVAGIGDEMVVGFKTKNSQGQVLMRVRISDGKLADPWAVKASGSSGDPVIDPAREMILANGVLMDLKNEKATTAGSSATYGAGYAWTTGTSPKRVDPEGHITDWNTGTSTSDAAVPADLTSDGSAVLVAKPESGSQETKLYVLSTSDQKDQGEKK